jgi:hypothetical protein
MDARTAGWRSDLQMLMPGMDAFHPQLDHGVSSDALEAAVDELSALVPELTDDELMVGVLRIVAMVSADGCDGHTGAFVWGNGTYEVTSLPLRLWLFGDDVYVVDALPPYERLVGDRIVAINNHATADVLATIDPIVPRDNQQTVRLLMPRFLLIPEILSGLGLLAAEGAPVHLDLESASFDGLSAEVEPIRMAEYNAWAGGYGLHLPADPGVPYLARIDDALWVTGPDARGTVFAQYNRVEFIGLGELTTALAHPQTTSLVLDIRHNFGGEVSAIEPLITTVSQFAAADAGATYLVTGRNTFSAASLLAARLDAETDVQVVGSAMGGCPNAWGDSEEVALPYSGMRVSVSTVFNVGADSSDMRPTIDPDIPAPLTAEEWARGGDPALDAIRAQLQ